MRSKTLVRCALFASTLALAACAGSVTTGDASPPRDAATGDQSAGDAASADAGLDATSADAAAGLDAATADVPSSPDTAAGPDGAPLDAPRADATSTADARASDATAEAGCAGEPFSCVTGTPGGQCGDTVTPARCVGGAWSCGAGQIDVSLCGCAGRPPGSSCTCSGGRWVCGDAGSDASPAEASVACLGRPASCVAGTAGGACGDALTAPTCVDGAWRCGPGEIPVTECACVGRPPGRSCVCTSDGWRCDGGDAGADAAADASAGDAARTFACGPTLRCASSAQYCRAVIGGALGATSYSCQPVPSACAARLSCACFASMGGSRCAQSSDGDITVTLAAP